MEAQQAPLCDVFNIGTGNGNTVLEVLNTFEAVNDTKVPHEIGPRRVGDVEAVYADTRKSRDVLGWHTQLTLADALRDAWGWQKNLG